MVLLAWRSQEMSFQLEQQTRTSGEGLPSTGKRHGIQGVPEGLPEHFFRKTYDPETGLKPGELDLRQVTGDEAYKYFSACGIVLPIMGGR